MKRIGLILACTAILGTSPLVAAEEQTGLDFQFRIPVHYQTPLPVTNDAWSRFGLAGWTILSDVTAEKNNAQSLLVSGVSYNYGNRGSWFELLGGSKVNQDGFIDPLANIRFLDKGLLPQFNTFGDFHYFPDSERRRFLAYVSADTPVKLGNYAVRLGVESENIFSLSGKKKSLGIGPRVVLPLPIKIHPSVTVSFTLGYQFRNDRDFIRGYLGITYRPKKN